LFLTSYLKKRQKHTSFFTPADLQGIGSFQVGGLKHNFAGDIENSSLEASERFNLQTGQTPELVGREARVESLV
jgi:hypothetical protein